MKRNIESAIRLYSGQQPLGIKADKLDVHIRAIEAAYAQIQYLFRIAGVEDFSKLPEDKDLRAQFAKHFRELNRHLNAARVQGFQWNKLQEPTLPTDDTEEAEEVTLAMSALTIDETTYGALLQRYKEIERGPKGTPTDEVTFDIDPYIISINTGAIDTDYMNARFRKYLRTLNSSEQEQAQALEELHRSFATLTQEEQDVAGRFLRDVQRGTVQVDEAKPLRDYITEYMAREKNDRIHRFAQAFGLNENLLREIMNNYMQGDIIPQGPLDQLKESVDKSLAKAWFEQHEGVSIPAFRINIRIDSLLRQFIEDGGFEI